MAHSPADVTRFIPSLLTLFFALSALLGAVFADCECGYSVDIDNQAFVFTDLIETDFAHLSNISADPDWVRQSYNVSSEKAQGPLGMLYAVQNVDTNPSTNMSAEDTTGRDGQAAGLHLTVNATQIQGFVPGAEIDTSRLDLLFGSYRAGIKLTAVPGTCSAFFWYFQDSHEIDMEFLSREYNATNSSYPVNLVLHSSNADQNSSHSTVAYLPFNPTTELHEFRLDVLANRVRFYADNALLAQLETADFPRHAGHLILQHWSNGNPLWSGGPPVGDADMVVAYVKAYFNSSSTQRQDDWAGRCRNAGAAGAICTVPEVAPANATSAGFFFSQHGNMTNNQTVYATNSGGRSRGGVWCAVPAMLATISWWLDV